MFTGIVREKGRVTERQGSAGGSTLALQCKVVGRDMKIGDSVAVSGVCLTAEKLLPQGFEVTATPETLRRTTLGDLEAGDAVNLEPALRSSDFLGGHLVQGHVDGRGRVESIQEEGNSWIFRFAAGRRVLDYCVFKGSITVDGVSLTISGLSEDWFEVAIIPHTYEVTTFSNLEEGDHVNLETDVISKYVQSHVERILGRSNAVGGAGGGAGR
ncbi:MAG TPA: riboflavin synthase [Acidobacteriota bacterium]|nr:riboflavin synthase [Acidobacteriota bacterium]